MGPGLHPAAGGWPARADRARQRDPRAGGLARRRRARPGRVHLRERNHLAAGARVDRLGPDRGDRGRGHRPATRIRRRQRAWSTPGGACVTGVWWSPDLTAWTPADDVTDMSGSSQVAADAHGFVSVGVA